MRRLLDIIWCRLAFYDYWNEISTTPEQIVEIPRLRREFPSVYAVIQTALNEKAPLEEIGQFIRVIDKTTLRLALLLIQMPTPTQITDFFEELRSYTLSRCPNFKVQNLQFPELATLLQNRMRDWRRVNPSMDFLSGLSFEGYADLQTAVRILSPLTRSVCGAMIRSFIPMFKKYMTSHGFGMIRQGYRIESGPTIPPTPWPGLLIHHIMLDEFDNGFRPTGERALSCFVRQRKRSKTQTCARCAWKKSR
jgi:predicted Zn-ribbon and HTH transcriptional regulator